MIYNFDKWHTAPLLSKRYARDIISYCNRQIQRNGFVEIGCGLGDIIRNVRYKQRDGYDIEQNVLNAAKFLAWLFCQKNISFHIFAFPKDKIISRKCDCIVLVNWIHNIQPSILKENLEKYFTEHLINNGFIIIDIVQSEEYQFNHDIKFLTSGLPCMTEKIGDYERQREVWAIRKNI
jgi:SAM-dependent methyltransferase